MRWEYDIDPRRPVASVYLEDSTPVCFNVRLDHAKQMVSGQLALTLLSKVADDYGIRVAASRDAETNKVFKEIRSLLNLLEEVKP